MVEVIPDYGRDIGLFFVRRCSQPTSESDGMGSTARTHRRLHPKERPMNSSQIIEILKANRVILDEFHVKALYLFGSTARGEERPGSDVDMLVEL